MINRIIPSKNDGLSPSEAPELVFGLVGPVGTDTRLIYNYLQSELQKYDYNCCHIQLSQCIHTIANLDNLINIKNDEYKRINLHMQAGTTIREISKRSDALALLSVAEVRRNRFRFNKEDPNQKEPEDVLTDTPPDKVAYVLDSLNNPDEIDSLRAIYGRAFFVISIFTPRTQRLSVLSQKIAHSRTDIGAKENCKSEAERLITIDEKESGTKYGQNVRETFPKADFFLDASHPQNIRVLLDRFLQLLFNNPFITPSKDEFGMFYAESSSWKSGDLARQVGASIMTEEGELVATGCNEVPKAFGGYYWDGDTPDHRDLALGYDVGTIQKRMMVAEILKKVAESEYITPDKVKDFQAEIENTKLGEGAEWLKDTQALSVIEFGRSVHAEMAALSDAAKRGISVYGNILYVNTFPCHICARHILSSGINRVIYIEPYPKSLTEYLYSQQIDNNECGQNSSKVLFKPFCGVAPRAYQFLFSATTKRKNKSGYRAEWNKKNAIPKLKRYVCSYIAIEQHVLAKNVESIIEKTSNLNFYEHNERIIIKEKEVTNE